jgi:pyruvate dehydrogenase E2 component (dihydrolipoamide acetyltransferase)
MAVEVRLPRLGQGMEAGTIVRWLKAKGDPVAKGEPLYELDTDKVTQGVEAEADGVLLEILVPEGEAAVGTTVAIIGEAGEDVSALLAAQTSVGDGAGPASTPRTEEPHGAEAERERGARVDEEPGAGARGGPELRPSVAPEARGSEPQRRTEPAAAAARRPGERVKASPLARRIARERGIDLAAIVGTGPEGRVIAEDVEQAAAESAWAPATPALAVPGGATEVEVVPLSSVRRTIARRLSEAWEAPVFQLTVSANASELVATRERMVALLREGEVRPTVSDVLTKLVAVALVRHPAVNAHFLDDAIHRYSTARVGLAVAAPTGLVVPVIWSAERRTVQEIAVARADLVERAREGKLQLVDLEGGTFTISNLGMYGIEQFTAVLNPPQVAILAVGAIEERPQVVGGELVVAPALTMTLTCDHRALDGSDGADFLRTVKEYVEAPALAL